MVLGDVHGGFALAERAGGHDDLRHRLRGLKRRSVQRANQYSEQIFESVVLHDLPPGEPDTKKIARFRQGFLLHALQRKCAIVETNNISVVSEL